MSQSAANRHGDYIHSHRVKAKISQNKLGRELGLKHGQFIRNIEHGRNSLPVRLIGPLCDALKLDRAKLVEYMAMDLIKNKGIK